MSTTVHTATEIRPFHVDTLDEKLEELHRRISTTRWPTPELFSSELRAAFSSLR